MKHTVTIKGYLFRDETAGLWFVSESSWDSRNDKSNCTYISSCDGICKEGSTVYETFKDFRGERKLIEVTLRG